MSPSLYRSTAVFFFACAVVSFGARGAAQPDPSPSIRVTALQTNAAVEPLGIDDPAPRLSWRLESDARGVSQVGCRVLVASSPERLQGATADVWDSGDLECVDPWVRYAGPPFASRTRYYWKVRVRAAGADDGVWSEPTWFETGILRAAEWRGHWIAGPERQTRRLSPEEGIADDEAIREAGEFCRPPQWLTRGVARLIHSNQGECREVRPAPMLRKSFRIAKPVVRARVYTTGLAYNDLTINGRPVSSSVLDPGFTNYSRTVLYTTHDVTALLRSGENVIASMLGSGQYDSSTRTWDWGWDKAQWRATPRLRLDLYVTYADGSEDVVVSDDTWQVSVDGPVRYDSYYLGETYDARREIPGWNEPGFDASSWRSALVVGPPGGIVRAQTHEPIRVVEERLPARRTEPMPGVYVYHVGQNLTGWATIRVKAPAGTAIEIFYTEKLGPDGRASTEGNDLVFGQLQTDYYIARGGGEEVWTPKFTYKGFEYVQVSGPNGTPLGRDVEVAVDRIQQVRSDLARASEFTSSNETLNRIHRNTVWAIQNNMHGIITDTPVYEKNAWTGDAALTAGTASILFDTERLFWKLFQDMLDNQTPHGEVPLLAPTSDQYGYVGRPAFKPPVCCGATPAWDAFWFVLPWESYQRHGNRAVLERTYPAMRLYLDEWIPRWTERDGDAFKYTLTAGLGDWVAPAGVPTINRLVSTAYYAHLVRMAANVARVLGKEADAARYAGLFEKIRADFNAAFLGDDGIYREPPVPGARSQAAGGPPPQPPTYDYVQSAQILALAFDLVPDERRAAVAAHLADDIRKNGGNPYVGVIGAGHVLPALTAYGQHDIAFLAATQTDEPSWGYWTDVLGFTSLGEHWPANTRSRNHHFFGAIVQWLYEDLAGMRPLGAGYRRIEFRPEIPSQGLDHVSASHESVRGTVSSSWRRAAGGLEIDVTVPPTATGVVYIPAADPDSVTEAGNGRRVPARQAEGVRLSGIEGDRVVFEVGSGTYRFRVSSK
ncbi:MAG TPA: family 78 glycoside hydrolase catalytic domain [Vicinamibacterales bacterium]|nr:family 78 glycoside hydrolase catalytic domain [Vicinamibacterales bacterium]